MLLHASLRRIRGKNRYVQHSSLESSSSLFSWLYRVSSLRKMCCCTSRTTFGWCRSSCYRKEKVNYGIEQLDGLCTKLFKSIFTVDYLRMLFQYSFSPSFVDNVDKTKTTICYDINYLRTEFCNYFPFRTGKVVNIERQPYFFKIL